MKLTPKRKKFVKLYTDEKNKETFGNGTQSAMQSYDVSSQKSASVIAANLLANVSVSQAIERKTRSKEDIEHSLISVQEKLDNAVNEISLNDPQNMPIVKQSLEHKMAIAKLNGHLIERSMNMNVHIDRNKDLSTLTAEELQAEVMKRMMDRGNLDT